MKIISAYKMSKSTFYVVFETPYAGASLEAATLEMDEINFEQFGVKLFNSSKEAYKYAYDAAFGDGAYDDDYTHIRESECEYGTLHLDGEPCNCGNL